MTRHEVQLIRQRAIFHGTVTRDEVRRLCDTVLALLEEDPS